MSKPLPDFYGPDGRLVKGRFKVVISREGRAVHTAPDADASRAAYLAKTYSSKPEFEVEVVPL